ncbi:ABC transporter substrate-binding protein [Rhodococcus antarcticus]|uniref:ABC transporter substrate-binding protein n=1 Tax=Rhodococcus antarcticus TaxID=2987751 RepID=A0ABY6P376_9NOCA|nr:ABC transporter substrate-binding protein [Rhodococcus antarcticus]UZJ26101.1 ABC transporter substrate-binding protein [Rhodococcus antarcticus]
MRARWALGGVLGTALLLGGCTTGPTPTDDAGPFLGLALAGGVTTYNPSTVAGAAGAGPEALARVLPGFSYTGPAGTPVSDTDVGTATELSPEPLTLRYTFDDAAVWSDGVPAGCADLVLARLAHSGANGFSAASTVGYADIAEVACAAGDRSATVTFAPGRADPDWRSLFGAGDLMPAHVAERATGVADVVAAVRDQHTAALARLATFWSTGWDLTPGALDQALLPALGPYRVDTLGADGILGLVANERWWGTAPGVGRLQVHLDDQDPAALLASGAVQVADLPSSPELVSALGAVVGAQVATRTTTTAEQLVLDLRGTFANPALRTALAQCLPRAGLLAQQVTPADPGPTDPGPTVLDTRLTLPGRPDSPRGPRVVAQHVAAAAATVSGLGRAGTVVRIGYHAPDPVRARTVELVARACAPAGFTVTDAGSPGSAPTDLGAGSVDAVLGSSPASTSPAVRGASLRTGAAADTGGYSDARVDQVLDALTVTTSVEDGVALCTEAEALLWADLPTVPLHLQQRTTAVTAAVTGVVPTPAAVGVGWNVDRWVAAG